MSQAQVRNDLSVLGRIARDPVAGQLTQTQLQALGHIVIKAGTATPSSVARAIQQTLGSASRVVERLVLLDLVMRRHDEIDKRAVLLTATRAGKQTQQRVADILGGKTP